MPENGVMLGARQAPEVNCDGSRDLAHANGAFARYFASSPFCWSARALSRRRPSTTTVTR